MASMRSLVALLTGIGALAGVAVGVVAHHSASQTQGWTLYAPLSRRYADYLPRHTPWFPAIIEYAALGLGAGLIAAIALTVLRFRLVRTRPGG
jgi:heme/copper-type cytochrome/quinol oxidase subunit 1